MSKKSKKNKGKTLKTPKLLSIVPVKEQDKVLSAFESLHDINKLTDVEQSFKNIDYLHKTYAKLIPTEYEKEVDKTFAATHTGTSNVGYEAAGSVLRRLYPHPFQMFSFVADNYWAALTCRKAIIEDVSRDGWVILAKDSYSNKQIKAIYRVLKDLKMTEKRLTLLDHLGTYGNFWTVPKRNRINGLQDIDVLLPARIVPEYDRDTDKVLRWIYLQGNQRIILEPNQVDHRKTISSSSMVIGKPPLAAVLVDIEAALHSSVYNNTLMQKGGLIQAIVAMKDIDESVINDKTYMQLAVSMQKYFDKRFSGVRGAGQIAFSPNIQAVYPLTKVQEMDGAYKTLRESCALNTCAVMGVPPERAGLQRGSQYRNEAEVSDTVNLSFDNRIAYLLNITDSYISDTILQEYLKLDGVRIHQRGEFNSLTKTSAEVLEKIGRSNSAVMTTDEFRTRYLHMEPWGGELGRMLVGSLLADKETGQLVIPDLLGPEKPDVDFIGGVKSKAFKVHKPEDIEYY